MRRGTGSTRQPTTAAAGSPPRVDPSGAPWQFGYDAAGRQTSLVDPLSRAWTTEYDAAGRPIRQTDPLQRVTLVRYDSMDQPIEVEAPDGVLTGYVYNRLGQVTHVTENLDPDPIQLPGGGSLPTDSRTTFLDINPWGVLERVVDPIGGETLFERDLAGRLTAVVDPVGNRTEYQYDAAGRLTRRLDPAPNTWWGEPTTDYAYNLNDQVVSVVDANGREREYLRDAAGRVTEERWSGYGGAASTIATTYDALDRPVAITDPAATLTFAYAAALDLTSVVTQPTGRAASRLDYAHDAAGRLVSTSEIGADLSVRSQTSLTRDAAGRVTRTRQTIAGDSAGREVNYGRDAGGRVTSITRGPINAAPLVTTSLGYDVRDRLTTLSHAGPSGPLSSYAYTYDVFGQLTSETNASPGGGSVEYDYDLSGQLTEVSGARNRTYEHDANGVRLVSPTDVVDGGNRLVWSGSKQFAYDAVGNTQMIWDGAANQTRYFAYDHRNRLVDAELRNAQQEVIASASFTYDALDRRIGVVEDADGAGPGAAVSTWTAFDGGQAWSDSDASGTVQARYLSGPAVDALLARSGASGETDWYLTDRLGSVRQVVDDSGASIFQAWFDEYGNETSSSGAGGDRFGFTGRDGHEALGLQWNRARYYLPEDGRWLSQDPIGFGGGDPNLYRYVGNSPTNATDPSGLSGLLSSIRQGISDGLNVAQTVVANVGQGIANAANGVTDSLVGLSNVPAFVLNKAVMEPTGWGRFNYLAAPDWSRDLFVEENDQLHDATKFAGGLVASLAFPFGAAAKLPQIGPALRSAGYALSGSALALKANPSLSITGTTMAAVSGRAVGVGCQTLGQFMQMTAQGGTGNAPSEGTSCAIHRIGGGSVENLRLKPAEAKLDPPGISVLKGDSAAAAAEQMKAAFPNATKLQEAAKTVGSTTEKEIRVAGFDVMPDPTKKFPNHHRLIHPYGVAGFIDENLARLSKAFKNIILGE